MKTMTLRVSLLAVLAMGLCLAGCQSESTTPESTAPAAGAAAPEGAKASAGTMGTGVEQAPEGVKTDLSGGLK